MTFWGIRTTLISTCFLKLLAFSSSKYDADTRTPTQRARWSYTPHPLHNWNLKVAHMSDWKISIKSRQLAGKLPLVFQAGAHPMKHQVSGWFQRLGPDYVHYYTTAGRTDLWNHFGLFLPLVHLHEDQSHTLPFSFELLLLFLFWTKAVSFFSCFLLWARCALFSSSAFNAFAFCLFITFCCSAIKPVVSTPVAACVSLAELCGHGRHLSWGGTCCGWLECA